MSTLSKILEYKIVSIIRGARPEDVLPIAEALLEGGIRCMEITLNSPEALKVIKTLSVAIGDRLLIGAGTVLDAASAEKAIEAGALFIISPITDVETIAKTKALGAVSMPGAFTPTEIFKAHAAGGDIIKVFPGSSGPGFIKEVLAPLPHIPLMPTGGVNLATIHEFKKAGAVAFGVGKGLVDSSKKVDDGFLKQLTAEAKKFMEAANTASL